MKIKYQKYIKVTDDYNDELKLVSNSKKEKNKDKLTEEEEVFTVEDNVIQFADENYMHLWMQSAKD